MATRTLTKKQKAYVEARSKGESKDRSAIMAGSDPANAKIYEKSDTVKTELERIRQEARTNTGVTREDLVFMFQEAANMARIIGDVAGLVAAAREMGKILGLYAPEVKKITHDMDANSVRKALRDMTEDELHRLAHGRTIVDAEVISERPALPAMRGDQGPPVVPDENEPEMHSLRDGDSPAEADAGPEGGAAPAGETPQEGDPEARG